MQKFKSVEDLINQLKPEKPVYCIRRHSVARASKFFQKYFSGDILYAVKTNPHPIIIKTLLNSGINQFDVASIEEIKQIRKFTSTAKLQLKKYKKLGYDNLSVCMAKTQYSVSDNPKLLGRPTGFIVTIRELRPSIGAGFIVALTGDVMTMPGLPKRPSALNMDVDDDGNAQGLF